MDNKSNAQKVRDYQKAFPTATPHEIAAACNVRLQYVYQVRHNDKTKKTKVQPRKATLVKKVEPKIVKVNRKKPEDPLLPNKEISALIEEFVDLEATVAKLEEEIIGYKAIIDFLEFQLNLKRNNRGATV